MKNKTLFQCVAALFCGFLFYSCQPSTDTSDCPVLKVDLRESTPSIKELFSRIEVVPLEDHNDNCLVMRLTKVLPYKDKIYVMDRKIPACYVFDKDGNFLYPIGKVGNGPGEYYQIEDCAINEAKQEFMLLDCNGIWFVYDLSGKFLRKQIVPDGDACQAVAFTEDGYIAHWIYTFKDREAIRLFNEDGEYVKGYWHQPFQFNFMINKPFYHYDGKVYFSTGCFPEVYELSGDTLQVAYRWDFGDTGINPELIKKIGNASESGNHDGWEQVREYMENGSWTFLQRNQYQTNQFYYVRLMSIKNGKILESNVVYNNVLYHKASGRSFVFSKLKEGLTVSAEAMTDDYMLSVLHPEDFGLMKDLLSPEEYAKVARLDEESNPCLLRLYFK